MIVCDAVKNVLTYIDIASMLPSEPWETQSYIVQLDNLCYLLQDVLPRLAKLSYEVDLQKEEKSVYMLRDFQILSKFTLNEDNAILHIG